MARIISAVEEAQGSKALKQQLVDRFAAIYTPVVIIGAIVLATAGSWITQDSNTWVYRALTLLVIACPCALVISTPVSIVSAIGAATKRGILIKGGVALEAAGQAQVVALDKTGTPVSYTHLDVYKRQSERSQITPMVTCAPWKPVRT